MENPDTEAADDLDTDNSGTDYLETPIGWLEIRASVKGITHVLFVSVPRESQAQRAKGSELTRLCKTQLEEYFRHQRTEFDLPLDAHGSGFQRSIWDCLRLIPYGQSRSYGDIAIQINNPKSVRAVGGANGKNPISIIVPCHRVIGTNGKLTGYAGGMTRKAWLLEHEGIHYIKP